VNNLKFSGTSILLPAGTLVLYGTHSFNLDRILEGGMQGNTDCRKVSYFGGHIENYGIPVASGTSLSAYRRAFKSFVKQVKDINDSTPALQQDATDERDENAGFKNQFRQLGQPELPLPVVLRVRLKEHCIITSNRRFSKNQEFVKKGSQFGIKLPLPSDIDQKVMMVIFPNGTSQRVKLGEASPFLTTSVVDQTGERLSDIYGWVY